MLIEASNLTKEFEVTKRVGVFKTQKTKFRAVNNINFSINAGEKVAFIGPNGAGKSTTIKMLTGIISNSTGNILVDGLNPKKDRKKLAYKIGCMFGQRSQLYMHLSVKDSFLLLGSIYDMDSKQVKNQINYITNLFEISNLLNVQVKKLSLGQRMICEIAASIIHNPQILFLDEPTIGLDLVAKERVINVINKLNKQKKITVFLTSHDVKDIESVADRIIIINKGKIIIDESLEQLRKEYFSEKIITVYFSNELVEKDIKSGKMLNSNTVKFTIDTNNNKIGDLISYCENLGNIVDMKIEEIPMEEIIKKFYVEV